jgi:hypothetical protein
MVSYGIDPNIVYDRKTIDNDVTQYQYFSNLLDTKDWTKSYSGWTWLEYSKRFEVLKDEVKYYATPGVIIIGNDLYPVVHYKLWFINDSTSPKPKEFFDFDCNPIENSHVRSLFIKSFFIRYTTSIKNESKYPVVYVTKNKVILNPKLLDFSFQKNLSGEKVFNEISMFLSKEKEVPVNISDKDRLQQHGFNNASFRNM